jgi:hypothetical protein
MRPLKFMIGLCFLLLIANVSFAEEPSPTVEKQEESVGRVTLESKEYPLDHYQLEADIGDGITEAGDRALHAINEAAWGFNKTISSFTLYAVDQLMSFDLISLMVREAGVMSERIFMVMSGTFLSLFIVIVGGAAAWRYFVNQQTGYAVKAILGALTIMVCTFWFYSNASQNIKWLNSLGADLEGRASSVNVLLSSDEFDTNATYDSQEGLAVLENQLFNLMVKRPYLLLNYGTTKESEIVNEDPNRVESLLEIKPYSEEGKRQRKAVVEDEVRTYENKFMSTSFSGERFGYLLVTILSTIALSIPILLLAAFKFLLQVWFLALVIFTAIPLVLSLMPSLSATALNHAKKLVGVLLMKAGLVLLIAVITGIMTLLYETVRVTNGVEGYAFVVFLIFIAVWGLFKYRSEIFEVASAGMIQGEQVAERMTYSTVRSIEEAGEKSIGGIKRFTAGSFLAGGYVHSFINRRVQHSESNNGSPSKVGVSKLTSYGGKSSLRSVSGEADALKGPETIGKGQGNKFTSVNRSPSRNAGGSIVNLRDYKQEKGEGTPKETVRGQGPRPSSDHSVSDVRKPGSEPLKDENKKQVGPKTSGQGTGVSNAAVSESRKPGLERKKYRQGYQTVHSSTSVDQQEGKTNHEHETSVHRNPAAKRDVAKGGKENSASREPGKHLTQWEVQQKLKEQKSKPPSEKVRRSVSRKGIVKKPDKDGK